MNIKEVKIENVENGKLSIDVLGKFTIEEWVKLNDLIVSNFSEVSRNDDFVILDCGGYKLMVSNWKGDSGNYDDKWITWYDSQSWVDEYCNKVKLGGFSDWVVPTKNELNLIYENKSKFTGKDKFTANGYWSSSEYSTAGAWRQYFDDGFQYNDYKTFSYRVRGVRRITL